MAGCFVEITNFLKVLKFSFRHFLRFNFHVSAVNFQFFTFLLFGSFFHVSFSRFYFSVRSFLRFNFHVSVVKFQFSRFYFTVRFSAFQFSRFHFSRFCFVSSCVKKYLFSDCFRLRNFGATCHQRSGAWRGCELRNRLFSIKDKISCEM